MLGHCTSEQEKATEESVDQVIEDVLKLYVPLVLAFCGIVINLINMFIFWKLGVRDSMSVNLFTLSLADFLRTLLEGMLCMCYLTYKLHPKNNINVLELGYFGFGWMMNAMYLTSCWITALITVERCFCVVFPFKCKLIFTKRRSIVVIATIGILHVGLHVPIYVVHKTECWENIMELPGNNNTETHDGVFTKLFSEQAAYLEFIFDLTASVVLGNLVFIIIIAFTLWMIQALHSSVRIRTVSFLKQTEVNSQKSKLSDKERKLVKVALALAVTLSLCSVPRIVVVAIQNSIPLGIISPISQYLNMMWAVSYMFTTLGCFVTFFVHLSLNNNYRVTFITTFYTRGKSFCSGK